MREKSRERVVSKIPNKPGSGAANIPLARAISWGEAEIGDTCLQQERARKFLADDRPTAEV